MRIFFKLIFFSIGGVILLFVTVFGINKMVVKSAEKTTYDTIGKIPKNKVGLLLGTGKKTINGNINLYYKYRIDATVALFESGKIDVILVSGDNSLKDYDEPTTMKLDLIARGIPASKIHLDYAGFRTLDSVVRCKKIFGQNKVTIISQKFHNERACFIAKRKGVEAVGFNAKDVSMSYGRVTLIREKLARVKMVLDLLFGKKPKFLGEEIEIQ